MYKTTLCKRVLFLSVCLFYCLSSLFLPSFIIADELKNSPVIHSSHFITVQGTATEPVWMQLWNSARAASLRTDKTKSISIYRELFVLKPSIEEALREYVILLMDSGQWQEAAQVIQKLLETDATSEEYLIYGGRIALVQKRYEQAAKHMGQVYTTSPGGPFAIEALKGQIHALQKLDRLEMAYPLMEQLYLIVPHEETLIRQLALYSKKRSDSEKALTYYTTLLTEFAGTDRDYLESIPLFETAGKQDMLVSSWHGYLRFHPFYLPFHKTLSNYYLDSNQEDKALTHLLIRIAHGEETPLLFLQTGRVFLYQQSRPDKALYYYEEYRKRVPTDDRVIAEIKRIQAILANDLLVIVENEGAWTLWRDLAKVIPDRLAVYYSMAEQLESLGKVQELLEVLEIINLHNSNDQETLFKLAKIYFSTGRYPASLRALDSMTTEMKQGAEYFMLRAKIAEKQQQEVLTLEYYKQYLIGNPEDYEVVFKCLQLAGRMGHIEDLHAFYALFSDNSPTNLVFKKGSFLYGKALLVNDLFSLADEIYRHLQARQDLSIAEKTIVADSLLTILQSEKHYFEAEQQLRLWLIEGKEKKELLFQLIKTSLLNSNWGNAWKWYEFSVLDSNELHPGDRAEEINNFLTKIEILYTSGQTEVALELLEDYFHDNDNLCTDLKSQCFELKRIMAKLYYQEGAYENAKSVLEPLLFEAHTTLDLHTLSVLIDQKIDKTQQNSFLTSVEDKPKAVLLDIAYSFEKHKSFQLALVLCEKYLLHVPFSLRARVLKAKLLRSLGDDFAALEMFQKLSAEYPKELGFKQNFLELQFKTAKFGDLIEELAPEWKPVKTGENTLSVRKVVPDIASLPVNQQLLLARAFWAAKRVEDSLLLYESLLRPPVEKEFAQQLTKQNIELSLPAPEKTFFNVISFTTPPEPDRLTVVMSPLFALKYLQKPEVKIAANLYSTYRWQQIVNREFSVRQAMTDGNYYQAMGKYQKILLENRSSENLYDLAGIYSRLGFLGKEAALYEIMKKESPGYPDLDEASQRNSLKRLPQIAPFFSSSSKDGREEHYDIRQRGGGIKAWFMPSFNHELLFDVRRIYSESIDDDQNLWRDHLEAEIKWSPIYDLDFVAAVGVESPDDEYRSTFLYDFRVNGRIGDGVHGYLGASQDINDDTVEALKSAISEAGYRAGLRVDLLPRLFGGAEYLYTEYSDGNHQNRYEIWSSYIIKPEPTLLQFRYGYEYSHNAEGNLPMSYRTSSGFLPSDHPYWSPKEYWQNLFTLSFEHQLAEDILGRGAPSYYKLEYSFGYEIGGYDNHEVKTQIFIEMNRHFLLNGSFEFTHGADIQEMNFICSVIYRW